MSRINEVRRTAPDAIKLARRIGPELDNHELAAALNAAGYQTGAGRPFDGDAVSSLRHYHGIGSPALLGSGELTVRDVAARLGVNHGTVISWVNQGLLSARRGLYSRWCIPFGPDVEARWRAHVATSPHVHTDIDLRRLGATERTPAQVAESLGINADAIYHWTVVGHVPWRRGPGGRKYIDFTPEVETRVPATDRQLSPPPQRNQVQSPTCPDRRQSMKPPSR